MKSFFLIILPCCLSWLTAACQSTSSVQKIEFSSASRGYQKQIFISSDSVVTIINGREESNKVTKRRLTSDEWQSLIKTLEDVSLNEIPQLPSPTSRRAFDGARHSTISIQTSDGNAWQHSFDDETPHLKLQSLMKAIKKIEGERSDKR